MWKSIQLITLASSFAGLLVCSRAAECGSTSPSQIQMSNDDFANVVDTWWRIRQGVCGNPSLCGTADGRNPHNCTETISINQAFDLVLTQKASDSSADLGSCYNATEDIINQCVKSSNTLDGSYTAAAVTWNFAVTSTPSAVVLKNPLSSVHETPTGAAAAGGGAPTVTPNPGGTNVHVNKGCISINNSSRCAGGDAYNVASQNTNDNTATLYARFDGSSSQKVVAPGCKLDASWPSNYGDVFFGEDNCLYDSSGNNINGQCCQPSDQAASLQVLNPYYQPTATCNGAQQFPKQLGDSSTVQKYVTKFCNALKSNSVKLNQDQRQLPNSVQGQSQVRGASSKGDSLAFSLVWSPDGCRDPSNPSDLDMSNYDSQKCVNNYMSQTVANCPNGGQLATDCALWSVNAF